MIVHLDDGVAAEWELLRRTTMGSYGGAARFLLERRETGAETMTAKSKNASELILVFIADVSTKCLQQQHDRGYLQDIEGWVKHHLEPLCGVEVFQHGGVIVHHRQRVKVSHEVSIVDLCIKTRSESIIV